MKNNVNHKKYYYNDSLREFEEANKCTDNIYELEDNSVLIILDDGQNLTSWYDVPDYKRVTYISEDLSDVNKLTRRYTYPNLKAIITQNISDKIKSTSYMFYSCYNLTTISGLDTWQTGNIEDMHGMFKNCNNLSDIHSLVDWELKKVNDTSYMFENCNNISSLNTLEKWDTSNIKDITAMFRDCISLKNLDGLNNWNIQSVTHMGRLFENCMNLKDIESIKEWKVSKNVNKEEIFKDCIDLDENIGDLFEKWTNTYPIQKTTILSNDKKETRKNHIQTNDKSNNHIPTAKFTYYPIDKFFDFYYSLDLEYVMKILLKEYEKIK